MFTASAFNSIRRNCPENLDELLQLLCIEKPDWDHGDEFEIAQELDDEINKKICALLKSDSDLEGYAKLLDMGGIKFSVNETRKERLTKILDNRDKILSDPSLYSQGLYIKITCNRAESLNDRIESSWNNKSIMPLIEPKEEINLSRNAQQKIKNILGEEYNLSDCDEIVISIIGKKSAYPSKKFSSFKFDDKIFEILKRLNEIYKKI